MDLLPAKLLCCRKSRKQRAIEKARQAMDREFNVVEILKSRRYFNKALKLLLPKQKRQVLIESSEYIEVDPSSCDEESSDARVNDAQVDYESSEIDKERLEASPEQRSTTPMFIQHSRVSSTN